MPSQQYEKKKSPSRVRKTSVGRRSRSRTRKTNNYLLVGREPSVSQTRITATLSVHRHTNGHAQHSTPLPPDPTSSQDSKDKEATLNNPTTIQLDIMSLIAFSLALGVRFYSISYPGSIVFDEQIIGSRISSYLRQEMYFSFDPPLVTQLFSAIVKANGGIANNFEFEEVGKDYDSSIPYVTLRAVSVLFGALLSPTVFHIMRISGACVQSSFITALFIAVDPAFIVQSRIFTPDSMVITLSMLCVYGALRYRYHHNPQSSASGWLLYCGLLCGIIVSMKYSAVFTATLAISLIAFKLWDSVADSRFSKGQLCCDSMLLVFSMLVVPVLLYMTCWSTHVLWLTKANTHDTSIHHSSLSSSLQLTENKFTPKVVLNGSVITLHHVHGRSCWLHSHQLLYPKRYPDGRGSSHQQQVTCYPSVDQNNKWIVMKNQHHESDDKLRHGDEISLIHESTGRLLNSHNVAAPLLSSKQEVSGYINYNISIPAQTGWVVEIDNSEEESDYWFGRKSHIKLIHVNTSAALSVTSNQLPDWAGAQYEVVADPFIFHENTLWVADEVTTPKHDPEIHPYKSESTTGNVTAQSTLKKIYEIHKRIFVRSYTYEDEHQFSSSPLDWITCRSNLIFWVHDTDNRQIHMLPNVVSWLTGILSLVILITISVVKEITYQRCGSEKAESQSSQEIYQSQALLSITGFGVNIVPYFLTDQPLLLYNYLPALVFLHLCSGYLMDSILQASKGCCSKLFSYTYIAIITAGAITFTTMLYPLIYGSSNLPDSRLVKLSETYLGWQFLDEEDNSNS